MQTTIQIICYYFQQYMIRFHNLYTPIFLYTSNEPTLCILCISPILHLSHILHSVTCMSDYREGVDWILHLLTTYTHDPEIQVITDTANLQNSQITTAPAEPFPAVPWQGLLTVENLQLHALQVLSSPYRTWLPQLSSLKLLGTDRVENFVLTVHLLLRVDSLLWEHV
jgi:hypothetical protein